MLIGLIKVKRYNMYNKLKVMALVAAMVVLMSGCSVKDLAVDAGNAYIKENRLSEKVTYMCYDLIDKKECPAELYQVDINILPIIPSDSRFCFGFGEEVVTPEGMVCVSRGIIK